MLVRARTFVLMFGIALVLSSCAHIPEGRYGVDELELEGVEKLDPYALRACLATRERESLSIDLSREPAPTCGKPPFDAQRIHLPLFRWPWTEWPLYDPSVFERDLARIERWYRARGYYGARLLSAESTPPEALYGTPSAENQVQLHVKLEEGEPVLIRSVSLTGTADLDQAVGATLLEQLDTLTPDMRFDEATFDLTKHTLIRTLRDAGYATAEVEGRVDIDPKARAADIQMTVKSGPFSEFGSVCVEGFEKLPAQLILQSADIRPGKPFSETELEDARTRIYQMRVFSEVEIIAGHVDPKTGVSHFDADASTTREGEWIALDQGESSKLPPEEDDEASVRVCRMGKKKPKHPEVPIEIRVKPGKLYRFGIGTGVQIGVEDGQRAVNAAQQWDVHLFSYLEVRNFIGGLRRLRLEERPRLVFPAAFPRAINSEGERGVKLGNNLSVLLEWPAFLEARTLLRFTASWDRGPDPYGGQFIRDDIDIGIGPSRSFFKNRLHVTLMAHANPYRPREVYDGADPSILKNERYNLLFLQQIAEWDQRDDRSSPHSGRYLRLELHESLPPSNWDYLRVAPEAREYIPLPYGLVLASRVGIGVIHIYKTDAGTDELRRLGPRPYRLRGGGPYSVRGVQAGALGLRNGDDMLGFPGGTRSWIASVELRVPLGDSFGIATFIDAGDVDGGCGSEGARFRFDHPNTTLGGGLRYKTIVGPVRLDAGFLVPGLSGARGGGMCGADQVNYRDPLFKFQGAVHLTIGEAF
jgi:hypothetical protein